MTNHRDEESSQQLLDNQQLEKSCVVANNRMNRERNAVGSNGYEVDLGFDPIQFLFARHDANGSVAWLDLCCGRGRALIEAGQAMQATDRDKGIRIIGVDLVNMFDVMPEDLEFVELQVASLSTWNTETQFDLITCVHGLHYIGDKLGLIKRAATWLRSDATFYANLDLTNLNSMSSADFEAEIAEAGMIYDKRKHLLQFGRSDLKQNGNLFCRQYLGANDQAGPNYTGQEAVCSVYR